MLKRIMLVLIALVLPPLAVFMVRGLGRGFCASLTGTLAATVVFFMLAAGPGVILFGVFVLHAMYLVVRTPHSSPSQTGESTEL